MDASQTESPSVSLIEDLDLWGLKCALLTTVLDLRPGVPDLVEDPGEDGGSGKNRLACA